MTQIDDANRKTHTSPQGAIRESDAKPGTVLVTGAASGIGKATAKRLAETGWNVHICDVSDSSLADVRAELPTIHVSKCDVSDPAQVKDVVAHVLALNGQLDVLINNAGIAGCTAPIESVPDDDWRRTMDVNVNGAFYFLKEVVPGMKQRSNGAIINIASTAALFGYPQRAAYAASKWAMIGMTKTLAMELGPFNIRVNAVCPGSVAGPRIDSVIERDAAHRGLPAEDVRRIYESQVSMRRFVTVEDIAGTCAFLASADAQLVSGQIIAVDGHTESLSFPF
jgi:NAD(P)-dependent dehydrogenase (short-subunit alcohol dehydrogenase family)